MKSRYFFICFISLMMITLLHLAYADGPSCGSGCEESEGAECNVHTGPTGDFYASDTVAPLGGNVKIAISKTSTLTVGPKRDVDKEICPDCTVNYPVDTIPESGIKWYETGEGNLTDDSGSTGTWVAPNIPKNDMKIILKFDDEGNYEDDGGLTQVASITIDAVPPTSETSTDIGDLTTTAYCQAVKGKTYGRGDIYDVTLNSSSGVSFANLTMYELIPPYVDQDCGLGGLSHDMGSTTIDSSNKWEDGVAFCSDYNDLSDCTITIEFNLGIGPAQYPYRRSQLIFHIPEAGINYLTTERNSIPVE